MAKIIKTPFDQNVISAIANAKVLNSSKTQALNIVNGNNVEYAINYNAQNQIDYNAINNYVNLYPDNKIGTIKNIIDQSLNNNNLIQEDTTKQPIINENNVTYNYFKFNNSFMSFTENNNFYNNDSFSLFFRFNVLENINVDMKYLFAYVDAESNLIYAIRFNNNNQIEFIINNVVVQTTEFTRNQDITLAWVYDVMQNAFVYKNNIMVNQVNIPDLFLKSGTAFLGYLGSIFNLKSFCAWKWNLLKTEINYLQNKF